MGLSAARLIFLIASVLYPTINTQPDQVDTGRKPPNDELRLLRYLLRTYDKSVRPVFNASEVVSVKIGLTLTHIFNIDEKNQVLSMNAWLEQEWLDKRIAWSPDDFGGLSQLTIPTRFLWTPDIVLYNNADDFSHGIMQTNVGVYNVGTILWAPPVKFRSTCKLDVTYFPFDEQICYLRFGSWIYDGTQVDVVAKERNNTISLDAYTDNGEWEIIVESGVTGVRKNVNFYPCCPKSPFPDLTFALHLKRRTLFYMYNIIIPCVMLSILTLMQFWLPCECGEKVTLGLTVLLAYSVFSFNIGENMPETSDVIPLIAIYIMCIMGISSISVTFSVIVLNMRHAGERKLKVPKWLKTLAYRLMGPTVGWKNQSDERAKKWLEQENSFQLAFSRLSDYLRKQSVAHLMATGTSATSQVPLTDDSSGEQLEMTTLSPNVNGDLHCTKCRSADLNDPTTIAVNDIMCRAGLLMDRFELEKRSEEIVHEWRKVARIFDQFFFYLVLLLTLSVTFGMLIVAPHFSRKRIEDIYAKMYNRSIPY